MLFFNHLVKSGSLSRIAAILYINYNEKHAVDAEWCEQGYCGQGWKKIRLKRVFFLLSCLKRIFFVFKSILKIYIFKETFLVNNNR